MMARVYPDWVLWMFSEREPALACTLAMGAEIVITTCDHGRLRGIDFVRQLRQRGSRVPVIVVSQDADAEEAAFKAGASEFIEKRGDPKIIEAQIRMAIEVLAQGPRQRVPDRDPGARVRVGEKTKL
jgi:FixJ family two-component response regulator